LLFAFAPLHSPASNLNEEKETEEGDSINLQILFSPLCFPIQFNPPPVRKNLKEKKKTKLHNLN